VSARRKKTERADGIDSKLIQQIRTAVRQVWSWSRARRLCIERCKIPGDKYGLSRCEKCGEKVGKIFPDHIEKCGDVFDGGYLERMFVPSKHLQGLCKKCHDRKTRQEREEDNW